MAQGTRFERGRERLREVHGERSLATIESLGDLGRLIVEVAYGDVYSRPALTLRERQIELAGARQQVQLLTNRHVAGKDGESENRRPLRTSLPDHPCFHSMDERRLRELVGRVGSFTWC
jgi:hypothetical protein